MKKEQENKNIQSTPDTSMSSAAYARFYSFFLLPLMIAFVLIPLVIALIYRDSDGGVLFGEDRTFSTLISNINDGSNSKRWHAAYSLAVELNNPESESFPNEKYEKDKFINSYKKSINFEESMNKDDSTKYYLRSYLIIAMGRTRDDYYGEILLDALDSDKPIIRLSAIQSLGEIQYKPAAANISEIINFTSCCKEKSPGGIKMIQCCVDEIEVLAAVIALGKIGDQESIPLLRRMLDHEQPNITWDAAIALAKMKDDSGKLIINNLLNRKFYSIYEEIDEKEIVHTILVALEMSSKIGDQVFEDNLKYLSSNLESNIDIRKAAKTTIEKIYN